MDRREIKKAHKEIPDIFFKVQGGCLNKLPEERIGGYYNNNPREETVGEIKLIKEDQFVVKTGKHGWEEIKSDPFFKTIDWDRLRENPRKYCETV